jgi:uncharacterized protein
MTGTVWHDGEIALQKRYGSYEQMADIGPRVIRDAMPDQHRAFFAELPFLLIGTVDGASLPWASLVTGAPGFIASPDENKLTIGAQLTDDDPAAAGFAGDKPIGLLGINLANRRRNRMNGQVVARDDQGFAVEVGHSFGNCPKYIQLRQWTMAENATSRSAQVEHLDALDEDTRALIGHADTFFVASYADRLDEGRQVDVSHRGGRPGFVRIDADGTLTIPDFSGNRFFNTLGNVVSSGKAGLLFIDFENGDLLQLSGAADIVDADEGQSGLVGAERLWLVRPERIVRRRAHLPLRWHLADNALSPFLARTGNWDEAAAR